MDNSERIRESVERIIKVYGRIISSRSEYIHYDYSNDWVAITYEAEAGPKHPFAMITVAIPRTDEPEFYSIVYEYDIVEDVLTQYVPGEWQDGIIALGELAKLSEMQANQNIVQYLSQKAGKKKSKK